MDVSNEASSQTAESKPARFPRESSLLDGRSAAAKTAAKALLKPAWRDLLHFARSRL